MTEIKQRIEGLRDSLNAHNHAYYVLNAPTISDREFDMMMKELEALEREYPEFDDPYSPTHRVGSDLTKGFTQARHIYPMLSLANTYSVSEVDDWVGRVVDGLGGEMPVLVGEMKFDGTSISLIYEHGRLVRAVTRGDGEVGDVVTDNVLTIKSIPLQLRGDDIPERFEIRGEIVLPWKAFDRLNLEREQAGEPLFANPRNAASGTLKMQNSAEVARRGLDAVFYYLIGDNLPCDNHYDNMMVARRWGFKVSDTMTLLHSIAEVDEYITHWDTARRELPMATDGLVFKVNSLRMQRNLGFTAKSPRWAIAYKFAAERALTRLEFVSFEVGRTGVITPVANLDPVLLSGTIVKRASLHNADIIERLDIHDHDMVYVEKGGEIIPKITGVDTAARKADAMPVRFVKTCPACGATLERDPGEAAWFCPNKWGCRPQQIGRIEHYVGRRMMNIDGIGDETARLLVENRMIADVADLYNLRAEQIARLPGFAIKSAERVVDGIRASTEVPFERVIYALSIPYVGETVSKKIARAVKNMDTLRAMTAEQLEAIEDVGPRIAEAIINFFSAEKNREIVDRLASAGVKMAVDVSVDSPIGDALAGKSIVISGTFNHHSRDEYKAMIEAHGGKNVGAISKKTDFILAGANMGPSKLEKAGKLGIPIIDEDTFLAMLDNH
ncbi:MAG: NAD-dependent DNA ligase LigA [Muribaculaceae bacterium]|nr:NAD-dependent DNA ligase LigA [Muribaculaceae bacterium]